MNEEKRAIASIHATTDAILLLGKQHNEALHAISEAVRTMIASSTELIDGTGTVVGYQIKTGALHRILGYLAGVDHPVALPSVAHKTTVVGSGFDGEVWYRGGPTK